MNIIFDHICSTRVKVGEIINSRVEDCACACTTLLSSFFDRQSVGNDEDIIEVSLYKEHNR